MPTSDSLSTFHLIMFAITGLTRLAYVLKTIAWLRPDPFPFWIPGILDRIIAAPIFALAAAAGRKSAKQAFDEGHIMGKRRGEVHAFWIALMLNAIFGGIHGHRRGCPAHGICAMGTLTGADYLLLFNYYDAIGRL